MIAGVNIIREKASVASINGAGGSGWGVGGGGHSEPLSSKWHLVWLKMDLNAAEIITVQDYKCKRKKINNVNGSTHIVLKSQAGNMSQTYNENTKRSNTKENELGILKIYAFCRKIQQRVSGPRESTAGVMYLSMKIQQKSCRIFPLKPASTLLSGSRKGAVGA